MKITSHGHACFKIEGKSTTNDIVTIITDPFDPKSISINLRNLECDILTISHEHEDHNFKDAIKQLEDKPFIITTPGEYEVKGLRIFGYRSFHDDKQGSERGLNTIYVYDFNEARVCHLGDLGHDLSGDLLEELSNIDVLLIPVGGIFTIDSKTAVSVIEKIEPRIVIPMHYKTPKHSSMFDKLETLSDFLKEFGVTKEPQKDLNIKSKPDLPEETEVVALNF